MQGMPTVPLGDIQKIVQQIVAYCHPQKVILFGSYAHGTPTVNASPGLLLALEPLKPQLARLSTFGIAARYPGVQADQQAAESAMRIGEEVRKAVRISLGLP
jgi:hypothetical protein